MPINDGGPAFPVTDYDDDGHRSPYVEAYGMSLRQYYVGQAMAHLPLLITSISKSDGGTKQDFTTTELTNLKWIAASAYALADALIAHDGRDIK